MFTWLWKQFSIVKGAILHHRMNLITPGWWSSFNIIVTLWIRQIPPYDGFLTQCFSFFCFHAFWYMTDRWRSSRHESAMFLGNLIWTKSTVRGLLWLSLGHSIAQLPHSFLNVSSDVLDSSCPVCLKLQCCDCVLSLFCLTFIYVYIYLAFPAYV